jgi:hypothetical protein
MEARRKTLAALERWSPDTSWLQTEVPLNALGCSIRLAKELPPEFLANQKKAGDGDAPSFSPTKRQIPAGHKFEPKALKPLARMLWAMSVSLGHALTAYRQFTKLKSSSVSPDGLVGGRGYVMSVKDVRSKLYAACESLSAISDTIHDEIGASHWKPKLGELEKHDLADVKRLLSEAEETLDDPEAEATEDLEEAEDEKSWKKPTKSDGKKDPGSSVPGAGDKETIPEQGEHPANAHRKELKEARYRRTGNSSVNPATLPGPRVDHLDRGEQTGPFGSYNRDEPLTQDNWGLSEGVGNDFNYPSEWENDFSSKDAGSSSLPTDFDTETEGYDFGIGYGGGNEAKGQGAGGYGLSNPSTGDHGVYGPRADLPDDPGGKTKDNETSDSTAISELALSGRTRMSHESLPGDGEEPVARSDYYKGPKGNDFNGVIRAETHLPGEGMPAKPTPLRARPFTRDEFMFADGSELPGDGSGSSYNFDRDLPNTGYKYERDQPYVKWDDNTHNMRVDPLYQRDPTQGPYVK